MGFTTEQLLRMTWNIKYRLPDSMDGEKGILMSKSSKTGKKFEVYKMKYLNQRQAYANKMAREFRIEFDIGHLYGKLPEWSDSLEIARFDKATKQFVFN